MHVEKEWYRKEKKNNTSLSHSRKLSDANEKDQKINK